jgi:hypothetical protein
MHKAQIHHEQPGYVAVLNKKAPHPRNPRSSPPFDIADTHLSPLVKLIHLSHTTVRCHPIHASFIRTSRHIHRERSDTQGKKIEKRGPETRYPESRFPNALILLCRVLGCCNVHLLSVKCTQRGKRAVCLNSRHDVCEEESRECKNRGEDETKEM